MKKLTLLVALSLLSAIAGAEVAVKLESRIRAMSAFKLAEGDRIVCVQNPGKLEVQTGETIFDYTSPAGYTAIGSLSLNGNLVQ